MSAHRRSWMLCRGQLLTQEANKSGSFFWEGCKTLRNNDNDNDDDDELELESQLERVTSRAPEIGKTTQAEIISEI